MHTMSNPAPRIDFSIWPPRSKAALSYSPISIATARPLNLHQADGIRRTVASNLDGRGFNSEDVIAFESAVATDSVTTVAALVRKTA